MLQIIIDQNEIEQAIKDRVGNMISIREGQEITIDLKAGRGENGFSATIEIGTPSEKASEPAEVAKAPITLSRKTKVTPPAETKQETAEGNPTTASGEDASATPEVRQEETGEAGAASEQDESDGEAKSAPKTGSIFSGLQRPKNS